VDGREGIPAPAEVGLHVLPLPRRCDVAGLAVDNAIRDGISGTSQKIYLHRSLKPIDQIDFTTAEEAGQGRLFSNECEGMCGV
jgi:hypothetical protein